MPRFPVRRGSPLLAAIILAGLAVVAQALLVPLFAAPAANLAPRDLPVVVAGPPPAAAEFAARLADAQPGAFEITSVADPEAADRALRDRQAYAAFVLGPDGPALHTAPAGSPTVAALLTQAAAGLTRGQPLPVVEVVPADPADPRGAGFASGFLPLAMTGLLAGALLALFVAGRWARLAGLLTFGVLAGAVGAVVLNWLGVLPGGFLANAGAIGLFCLATAATVSGLASVLGRAGIGLGALLVFLVGNAISAIGSAPELLAQPWGTLGQWLPVGAGGNLLRSTAFFDGAGATLPMLVLAGYAVVGLILVVAGRANPATANPATANPATTDPATANPEPAVTGRSVSAVTGRSVSAVTGRSVPAAPSGSVPAAGAVKG